MFKKEKHTLLLSSFWDVLLLNLMPMDSCIPGVFFISSVFTRNL
jgi:hypothetical protein